MAAAASSKFCPNCPPDDVCGELRKQIRDLVFRRKEDGVERGLVERIKDQINGGQAGFDGHDQAIKQVRSEIKKRMKDFSKNDCGDKTPIGSDAKNWINEPNPTRDDLLDQTGRASSSSLFSWDGMSKATGLTGGALAAYLIVSEGSRLFPPRDLIPVP